MNIITALIGTAGMNFLEIIMTAIVPAPKISEGMWTLVTIVL